jgi:hypothetical protein
VKPTRRFLSASSAYQTARSTIKHSRSLGQEATRWIALPRARDATGQRRRCKEDDDQAQGGESLEIAPLSTTPRSSPMIAHDAGRSSQSTKD